MARRGLTQPDSGYDREYADSTQDPDGEYYIDRGSTSDTSSQVQQSAEQTADSQEVGDNIIERVVNIFTREGRVDTAYDQELNAQARELLDDASTREPPKMMAANYMSNPHPELKRMVTEDVDPAVVGQMGDAWIETGNAMTRFQSGVAAAINNSEADWQGQAGNAARTYMAGVGNWVGSAGESAQLVGTQTNIQADALSEAKVSMPEPVAFDVAAANRDLQTTTNPVEMMSKYATYMAQYTAQQNAHEQAARVLSTYDSSLAGASAMPAFAPPPQMNGGSGSLTPVGGDQLKGLGTDPGVNPSGSGSTGGAGSAGGAGGGGSNPGVPTLPGGPGGPGGAGGGGGSGSGGGPGGGVPGLPGGPGGTDPSAGGGGPNPGPGGGPPLPGGPGPGGLGPGPGGNQNPGGGPPLPFGPGVLPGPDGERGGGRGFGPGTGPGTRGFGPGGGFGTGGGLGSGGGPGSGFGSGSGAGGAGGGSGAGGLAARGGGMGGAGLGPGGGALAAESAAMRGGAVGAAGRGGIGMGAVPGGRGRGEEDEEHQRPSFLVEGDPDAVFGTDEMTAPPVIGE